MATARVPASLPRIGKYEVRSEIGHGAAVRVYRAFDEGLGRPVTLTLLAGRPDAVLTSRFCSEVAIAGKLRTDSFIAVYELAEHAGGPFAAMQVLGEDDLGRAIRARRHMTLLRKVLILRQVAEGAMAAHCGGLPHIGLQPSAVSLDENGRATIQNFGVVRLTPDPEDETQKYAAPEGISDAMSDVFSFGVLAYQLIGGDPAEVPAPLRTLAPDCSEDLQRLVHRALDPRRSFRYGSFDEVLEDLDPILRDLKRKHSVALLAEAGRLLSGDQPEAAQPILREVLQFEPDNRRALRLRSDLRSILEARNAEKRNRLDLKLGEASGLMNEGQFNRAMVLLCDLSREFRGEAQVTELLERACALRERAETVAGTSTACDAMLRDGQVEEAIDLLKRTLSEYSDEAPLAARLAEIETLRRVDEFAELEQWQVALAVVEEALQVFPASHAFAGRAEQLRSRLAGDERRKKLARRIDAITLKVNACAWAQALMLIEAALPEFPDEPELDLLRQAAEDRRLRENAENVANLVRQCLAEGEPDRAAEILSNSAAHPVLDGLQEELNAAVQHRDEWRAAQVLFARRQYEQAEHVLARLVSPGHPEVEVLLRKAKEARRDAEGRRIPPVVTPAPILPAPVSAPLAPASIAVSPVSVPVEPLFIPPTPVPIASELPKIPRRDRRAVVIGACAAAALAAASIPLWLTSRTTSQGPPHAAVAVPSRPTPPPAQVAASPDPIVSAATNPQALSVRPTPRQTVEPPPEPPRRTFSPPQAAQPRATATLAPAPLVTAPVGSVPALPEHVATRPYTLPAPPPAASPAAPAASEPAIPVGGNAEVAKLISGPPPVMPRLAAQLRLRGSVTMQAIVDTRGLLKDVKVVSGHNLLASPARDAVMKWRYQPATLNGEPVESKVDIRVTFLDR